VIKFGAIDYGRSYYHIGRHRTALRDIGPHLSFIVYRIGPQMWPRHSEKTLEGKLDRMGLYLNTSDILTIAVGVSDMTSVTW